MGSENRSGTPVRVTAQQCGRSGPPASAVPFTFAPGAQGTEMEGARAAPPSTGHGAREGSSPTACVDSCCCFSSLSRAATFLLSSLVSVQPRESPQSSLQMLAGGRHAQRPLESGGSHRPVEVPPGLEGELREVRKPGPRPPCFLLAGCHVPTSLGLCPPRRQREAQRDQGLAHLPPASQ